MRTVKIVDIAEQIRGVSYNLEDVFDTGQENTVPLLRANNIQDTGLNYDDLVYVQKSKVSPKQLLRQGDILVCASSGSRHLVGKAGYVYNDFGTFGAFCKVLRPNTQLVNSNYFAHYFQSQLYRRAIADLAAGANINNIKNEHLNELQIKLPCLQEQNTIARVLDKTNAIIGKRKAQLSCLNELAKSRFIEMFGDPIKNPKKWNNILLDDFCEVGSSKRIFEKEYVSAGVPFYRTKEVVELAKGNNITTELFISKTRFGEILERFGVPQKNDLLITAVGTIGIIWVVDKTPFYFKDGNLLRITYNKKFNPIYLKFVLEQLLAEHKKQMSAGTAYAALTITDLKKMKLYDVPLSLQNEFAAFIEQLDKSKFTIRKSLEKLETLYRALSQEYFG